jgi:hypothetical protein
MLLFLSTSVRRLLFEVWSDVSAIAGWPLAVYPLEYQLLFIYVLARQGVEVRAIHLESARSIFDCGREATTSWYKHVSR